MQMLQWETKGTRNWTNCSNCCQHHSDCCGEFFLEFRRSDDDFCFLNYTRKYSQLSTSSKMPQNFIPTFVYQRRRQTSACTKPSDGCTSAISSEALSFAAQEHMASVSEHATENCSEMALTTHVDRVLNSANDDCSSSKSNLELSSASLKIDMDDAGECSSSGALVADMAPKETSERDLCISILRSQGLLDRVRQGQSSAKSSVVGSDNYCLKSCKVCEHMESTSNMLICDNCEDAFHTFCYDPHIKILPVGEWLCSSCSKKKHKILKDKSTSSPANVSNETVRNRYSVSEGELGSLEFMFRDTEPYMSSVRIGDEFQADVPDWFGPIDEECDLIGDPLEMNPFNNFDRQERNSVKPLKRSSIGNWLQCQEVVEGTGEGDDGTICAKWRRAPLFEVQTDDWECFDCVLWDPARADCSVPQELDTEEVMKQLKYIDMLRPRLAAKRRKLDSSKSSGHKALQCSEENFKKKWWR